VAAFDAELDYAPGLASDDNIFHGYSTPYPFNLTVCRGSVPAGFTRAGLPVGMQIVGRHLGEAQILRLAAAFEEARPWAGKRPPLTSSRKAA